MRFSLQRAFNVLNNFMNRRVATTDEDRNSILSCILLDIFEREGSRVAFFRRLLHFGHNGRRHKFINKPGYVLTYKVWPLLIPSIRVGDDEH